MPINFPTLQNVIDRIRSDVRGLLPDVDPTIFGNIIRGVTDSQGSRVFDTVQLIRQAVAEVFPQTASGEFLDRWGNYHGLPRNAATGSSGEIVFLGTAGASIASATSLTSSGLPFTTASSAIISTQTFNVTSLTRDGSIVTGTATGHPLATGLSISISGADQAEYNGTFLVTVQDANTFTYTISGTPVTPATGTIGASFDGVTVSISSDGVGSSNNLSSGAVLNLVTPISGVSTSAFVRFSGITGAANLEGDEPYRDRILQRSANPVANFNISRLETTAKGITGVTRVWVLPITPTVGSVTVYFVRDDDASIIPDANEISDVRNAILAFLPVNSDESQVFVLGPVPVTTDYTFSAISPDTATMREAIRQNIIAFYEDRAELSINITQDQYRAAIQDTQDPETGEVLQSFTLSTPTGDITIDTGEIGLPGEVTFS